MSDLAAVFRQAAVDLFDQGGTDAVYRSALGAEVPLRVLLGPWGEDFDSQPGVELLSREAEILVADVAKPARRDVLVVDGQELTVRSIARGDDATWTVRVG